MDIPTETNGFTRREVLKVSGMALGGLAIGEALIASGAGAVETHGERKAHPNPNELNEDCTCVCPDDPMCIDWPLPDDQLAQEYTFFEKLPSFYPFDPNTKTTITPQGENEMRITFMGSCIPPVRRAQQMMSVFVEVGWDPIKQMPLDQFVFDCGSGVCANYGAMNVGFGRMNKIFLAHLHGDHMSDLTHIYCFGPSADRKSPLYVWGSSPSGVRSPRRFYNDGTNAFCKNLREACRWHSESFSFQPTSYPNYPSAREIRNLWGLPSFPVQVSDDPWGDGYAMVPIELDWTKYGKVWGDNVAYHNKATGVRITHFPVIHDRKGSMGYKLEWHCPNGEILSMIYTSDTKPEIRSRDQAINRGKGVDVFIHEMVVPAQVWAMKNAYSNVLPPISNDGVQQLQTVQNSSHTPQGAFGYLLSTIIPRPRLTVATHFPVANDTVECALNSVKKHCPDITEVGTQGLTWSFDLMVISVSKDQITQYKGAVMDYGFSPTVNLPPGEPNIPKYHNDDGTSDPYAQIDLTTEIPNCNCSIYPAPCNYRADGF